MVDLTVKVQGVQELRTYLSVVQKQLPFATAKALTGTAVDGRDYLKRQMKRDLDRPTPFTVRGITIQSATKARQFSRVFVKDIQAGYLFYAIEGGLAGSRIKPANIRLNRYGNIPRKALTKLLARPDVFYGTIRGITGIWQRGNARGNRFTTEVKSSRGARGQTSYKYRAGNIYRNVRLIAARDPSTKYKTKFDFYGKGIARVDRVYPKQFSKAIDLALQTAR